MSTGVIIFAFIILVALFRHKGSDSHRNIKAKPAFEMACLPCPAGCGRELIIAKGAEPLSCLHCWLEKQGEQP